MSDTPDIKSLAVQTLAGLLDSVKQAKDFTMEQAPDVLRQMVTYYAVISWVQFVASALWIIALVALWYRLNAKAKWDEDATLPTSMIGMLAALPAAFGITSISTAIMATWAPKWFILTKLVELIK